MSVDCYQFSQYYPGIYTIKVPPGPPVNVTFGSKLLHENHVLYKVFFTRLHPPVNITADIPDCRLSGLGETNLKVNDIPLDTSFAPSICPLENFSLVEERVYESHQRRHHIEFQGYLEEDSLEPFFESDSSTSFLTQIGQFRTELSSSFSSPGLHTVKVPAGVTVARGLVVGGGGGGGGTRTSVCSGTPVGGGGGGAGGTAFGDVTVKPGDKLYLMEGKSGDGGQTGYGGGPGTGSTFVDLAAGGGRGGSPGTTHGPGSGGKGGGGSGPTVKDGKAGDRGVVSRSGLGAKPYHYELYPNGEGGAGGGYFGDFGKPGKDGLVNIIFGPSSSVADLNHFLTEYKQLAQRCGLFSVVANGPLDLFMVYDDEDEDEVVVTGEC